MNTSSLDCVCSKDHKGKEKQSIKSRKMAA